MLTGGAPGVIDQNIDPAESRVRRLGYGLGCVVKLEVPDRDLGLAARFPDLFRDLVGPVAVASMNHDQDALAAHHLGDCRADS